MPDLTRPTHICKSKLGELLDYSHVLLGDRSRAAADFATDLEYYSPMKKDADYAKNLILQWGTVDRIYANGGY